MSGKYKEIYLYYICICNIYIFPVFLKSRKNKQIFTLFLIRKLRYNESLVITNSEPCFIQFVITVVPLAQYFMTACSGITSHPCAKKKPGPV